MRNLNQEQSLSKNVVNVEAMSPTLVLLSQKYSTLVTQEQLAEIFHRSIVRIRALLKNGTLPLKRHTFSTFDTRGIALYKLSDVADFIDNAFLDTQNLQEQPVKKGRPVGSRNKSKLCEQAQLEAEDSPSCSMSM